MVFDEAWFHDPAVSEITYPIFTRRVNLLTETVGLIFKTNAHHSVFHNVTSGTSLWAAGIIGIVRRHVFQTVLADHVYLPVRHASLTCCRGSLTYAACVRVSHPRPSPLRPLYGTVAAKADGAPFGPRTPRAHLAHTSRTPSPLAARPSRSLVRTRSTGCSS